MRVEGVEFAKFLKMPSWLPNCWRLIFSCFAKFSRMPTSFSKLLKMLQEGGIGERERRESLGEGDQMKGEGGEK